MDNIDREVFISLVEERDVLWDKTLEGYKDKRKTYNAWRDICVSLNEDFETLTDVEKCNFAKLVTKKWRSMRDEWMKCHKRLIEGNTDTRKYVYYDNMKFLIKIAQHKRTDLYMERQRYTESDESADVPLFKKKKLEHVPKEIEKNAVDKKMLQLIDNAQKEKTKSSRAMSFFDSIAPTVDRFSDEDMIEFQYQVISIIRNLT